MANLSHKLLAEEKSSAGMLFDSSSRRPGLGREAGEGASNFLSDKNAPMLKDGVSLIEDPSGAARGAARRFGQGAGEAAQELSGAVQDVFDGGSPEEAASDVAGSKAANSAKAAAALSARRLSQADINPFNGKGGKGDGAKAASKTRRAIENALDNVEYKAPKTAAEKAAIKEAKLQEKATSALAKEARQAEKAAKAAQKAKARSASRGSGKRPNRLATSIAKRMYRRQAAKKAMQEAQAGEKATTTFFSRVGKAVKGLGKTFTAAAAPTVAPVLAIAMVAVVIAVTMGLITGTSIGTAYDVYQKNSRNDGEKLAASALKEYETGAAMGNYHYQDGKYWNFANGGGYSDGDNTPWCSCFVMYCWNGCGFDKSLGYTGTPLAVSWAQIPINDSSRGQLFKNDDSYNPLPGDIIVNGDPYTGSSGHVGIVVESKGSDGRFRVVEGNAGLWVNGEQVYGGDAVSSNTYALGSYWNYAFRPNYPKSSGTALGEGVNFSVSERRFVREWAPKIDNWYATWGASAPLSGYGEEFAKAAYKYKYDPRLSPAISRKESGGGRYCFKPHNAWGWGSASWSSWEEAIDAHVSGLSRGYSDMTIEEIFYKYAPPEDGNDTEGYIRDVKQWFTEM